MEISSRLKHLQRAEKLGGKPQPFALNDAMFLQVVRKLLIDVIASRPSEEKPCLFSQEAGRNRFCDLRDEERDIILKCLGAEPDRGLASDS